MSRTGSVDWCCLPRFDRPSVFGRLLDWKKGGHFQIWVEGIESVRRRYLPSTNILETTFETADGTATLTDFMPSHPHEQAQEPFEYTVSERITRLLRCVHGTVRFFLRCQPRFEYGGFLPHTVLPNSYCGIAHGGAQGISLCCSAPLQILEYGFWAEGYLRTGEVLYADLAYEPRILPPARQVDGAAILRDLDETRAYWERWSSQCTYTGGNREEVLRSALTLKALTYAPSGALLAAPTTSLPERIGGSLHWDYRFTWIRDAMFVLYALFLLGFREEATAFQQWLQWSTAGRARDLQLVYGLGGERRLPEIELDDLEGYRGSRPVRIGNVAQWQLQLDIYGQVADSAYLYHRYGGEIRKDNWDFLRRIAAFVMAHWQEPDEGIWDSRAGRQHNVYSKVMCWVALERVIKLASILSLTGDLERWQRVRDEIREDVLTNGYDEERGYFVQAYGSKDLDAAVLLLPLVGFIPADDPRMRSTIRVIERELTSPEGMVYRNQMHGPKGSEGTFAICTFWLADNLIFLGELDRARALFDQVQRYANDLGLFSEEIDPGTGEMLGNFPQAFTHLGHISTAVNLHNAEAKRG